MVLTSFLKVRMAVCQTNQSLFTRLRGVHVGYEHTDYPVHFFPVVDTDHICLQGSKRFADYKNTDILPTISSTIQ